MTPPDHPEENSVPFNILRETHLHAALKQWYAGPNAQFEQPIAGYVIDIVQDDLLIEVQTRNFRNMKKKLNTLLDSYRVRLVHPVAAARWITKLPKEGQKRPSRRKSPRRGTIEDVFLELVTFPELLAHPNFSLHVLLTHEEEYRRYTGKTGWRRRGWVTDYRALLDVVDNRLFETPQDVLALIPEDLPEPFTTAQLAKALNRPRRIAQTMAYCLRGMSMVDIAGKEGNAILYNRLA